MQPIWVDFFDMLNWILYLNIILENLVQMFSIDWAKELSIEQNQNGAKIGEEVDVSLCSKFLEIVMSSSFQQPRQKGQVT